MRELEDRYWWYRSLHALVRAEVGDAGRILDVGCGTGGMLACLRDRDCTGIDISGEALALARGRGLEGIHQASATELPFPESSFDAVLLLDVIYHRAVENDAVVLSECARVMRTGGVIILQAPAYACLSGTHDRAVHGERRYTAAGVRRLVEGAGLEVTHIGYRNFLALPFAIALRLVRRKGHPGRGAVPASDLRPLPGWIDRILFQASRLENAIVKWMPLPAGLSVWCIARKSGKVVST
ncbi:MAG TPA: class I SAM-dependent methyltransferase [Candidatus Deferrimicrobiaceae bacterium]